MKDKPLRTVLCAVAVVSALPYLTLKALWLLRTGTGATGATAAAELTDPRHLVGDAVTVGMQLVAITLALALSCGWGRRVPAALVLAPVWVAVGLLAPIAVGLPFGVAIQLIVGGSPVPTGNGLHDWVYAVVYGGFIIQAAALVGAFAGYARDRWPAAFLSRRRMSPGAVPPHLAVAAAVATGYAVTLALWSLAGTAWGAPAGFATIAQRTFLAAEGSLVLLGVVGVLCLFRGRGGRPAGVPLALAWVGSGVTTLSGPAHLTLSHHGQVSPLHVTVFLVATLTGLVLAGAPVRAIARATARSVGADSPSRTHELTWANDRG